MNYLETEIDEALEKLWIKNRKLNTDELKVLIISLCELFYAAGCDSPDRLKTPDNLNVFYLKRRDIHLG
jgi:hypothetical protein